MSYDFSTLSPADFEDLAREIVGRELRCRFEGFSAGPDGGIDGRHAAGKQSTILQAKHYFGSSYSSLKAAIKRELRSIRRLKPTRYVLATSRPMTPLNKDEIESLLSSALRRRPIILGPKDLNSLLHKFPDVEKSNIKLWLTSTAVLERVIRSGAHAFNAITSAEVEEKVKIYVPNPSFKEARDKLERTHVIIISGPPGVGKTTLAEMLTYTYVGENWKFVAIRNLDDGFSAIVDAEKQIFFFDDFLGKVALDERSLSSKDSELAKFIKRIQKSPNARFVLTTRAYIFEEARRASEYLGDRRLDIVKYVLDVGVYTRRIRARILFNHLHVFNIPKRHVMALLRGGTLPGIVDHPNYNPRIIEWMTDLLEVETLTPRQYVLRFQQSLNDPTQIWDKAFTKHIPTKCQNLLFCLFFSSEYGAELEDVKIAFDSLHLAICKKYGHKHSAKDFAEALRILEGSFLAISDGEVSFVNPSVRDYLTNYLKDENLLSLFARSAQRVSWAREVWNFYQKLETAGPEDVARFAENFVKVAQKFPKFPVWKKSSSAPHYSRLYDDSNSERIRLLLEWWDCSRRQEFSQMVLNVVRNPVGGFNSWLDGNELVGLVRYLKDRPESDVPDVDKICDHLEMAIIKLLDSGIALDELSSIADSVYTYRDYYSPDVYAAIARCTEYNIDEAESLSARVDSESTLDDHLASLTRLAARIDIADDRVKGAKKAIEARKSEIRDQVEEEEGPSVPDQRLMQMDKFDDHELHELFQLLVSK